VEHRDECADGCPSAPLLEEIARRPVATTLLGMMIGTLQLTRALTDSDLSDQLLARRAETA
jgi:TetR/AcrR family transcriptional repressor of nem operon